MTREEAIEFGNKWLQKNEDSKNSHTYKFIQMAIKALEQEPRKGHWIIDTHKVRASGKKYETHNYSVHCDKCNYSWDYTTDKEGSLVSNFCPNCGAKMESLEVHYV